MVQRFFRCPHCRMPHDESETVCSATGLPVERRRTAPPSSPPLPSSPPRSSAPLSSAPPPGGGGPEEALLRGVIPPLPPLPRGEGPRSDPPRMRSDPPRVALSRVGEVFDGVYLVRGVLGRGATAVVYDGEHQVLGRSVALKVMTAERVQSSEARKRFLQEAQAAASLSHPNICQIFDLGTLPDGALYCAMEHLQGDLLASRIEQHGALPVIDAVEFAWQMLAGLGAAHRKGIVHRDIKPENVFLAQVPGSGRPVVKLLDFGLAKLVHIDGEEGRASDEITRTGVVVGTPFYMAPESVTGQRDVDARADLWAAGVVLYLMLTGKLPFRGPNWTDTAQAILHKEPVALTELRPSLPERLVRVVTTSLAKNRQARYASAADFGAELSRVRRELR